MKESIVLSIIIISIIAIIELIRMDIVGFFVFLLLYFASFYVAGLIGEILSKKESWNTVDYIVLTLATLVLAGAISAIIGAIVYFAGFKQYLMIIFWYLYNILLLVFFTIILITLSKLGGESCGRRRKENEKRRHLEKRN